MARSRRPTLADIARRTGFSVPTVSMALNDKPGSRIADSTAKLIKEAAAELGYVADATARSLRTGRTATIGFISDEVTVTRFAAGMLRGLLETAEQRDHSVMIAEVDHHPERIARALGILRSHRVDGLVLGMMTGREIALPAPEGAEARIVLNGISEGWPAVGPDEFPAGQAAVRHLLERGHRRIALIGRHPERALPSVSTNIPVRLDGIDDATAEAGLRFTAEHHGDVWEPELGFRGAHAVLDAAPDTTAILAVNDRVAFGVLQAAAERGLCVPADLSLISFDDEELATMVRPQLTTLRLPYREMGEVGAGMLLDAVTSGAALPAERTLLPLELIERDTVQTI
ncbi:LacI family DNA-binding transcriptional regulator [Brachybacterium aquaticum]|uniref:LacI family transcriptional regulator n=1 Tax=Brachybacterium aquaticum TaxID=1432564 RepID=A0A841A9P2_9MICO|nr:LacI family DNA-binding transcriptional regulator [Brachybacterium aquaticum]MBB5831546.1 LacI family transcriptional regulator [Brachybacterium aquaticum]